MDYKAFINGACGGGGGGCYEDFRRDFKAETDLEVVECNIDVYLCKNLQRAKYNYNYALKSCGTKSQEDWFFIIPFSKGKVTDVWAKDNIGGLEHRIDPETKEKTRLSIKFRQSIEPKKQLNFSYGYETDIIAIIKEGFFSKTVTYNDWFSHNNPCNILNINVHFFKNCKVFKSVPPSEIDKNPIKFDVDCLRPLEYYSFLLAYQVQTLSSKFWLWIISAIGSGIIGVFLRKLFF